MAQIPELRMVNWAYYPKSDVIPGHLFSVIGIFKQNKTSIESPQNTLRSDEVLSVLRKGLTGLGFKVEKGKGASDKIKVPVLFGRNGVVEKSFAADAYHEIKRTVLEVEAGRGVTNYQFLKDLFEACVMQKVDYLAIAVRKTYSKRSDFEVMATFFDTLYASARLELPLKGILIIGY